MKSIQLTVLVLLIISYGGNMGTANQKGVNPEEKGNAKLSQQSDIQIRKLRVACKYKEVEIGKCYEKKNRRFIDIAREKQSFSGITAVREKIKDDKNITHTKRSELLRGLEKYDKNYDIYHKPFRESDYEAYIPPNGVYRREVKRSAHTLAVSQDVQVFLVPWSEGFRRKKVAYEDFINSLSGRERLFSVALKDGEVVEIWQIFIP